MYELILLLLGSGLGVSGTLGVQYWRLQKRLPRDIFQVKVDNLVYLDTTNNAQAKRRREYLRSQGHEAVIYVNGENRG